MKYSDLFDRNKFHGVGEQKAFFSVRICFAGFPITQRANPEMFFPQIYFSKTEIKRYGFSFFQSLTF